MSSTSRFRLWLLLGSILVVLLCRGFRTSLEKVPSDPDQPTLEDINSQPSDSTGANPVDHR